MFGLWPSFFNYKAIRVPSPLTRFFLPFLQLSYAFQDSGYDSNLGKRASVQGWDSPYIFYLLILVIESRNLYEDIFWDVITHTHTHNLSVHLSVSLVYKKILKTSIMRWIVGKEISQILFSSFTSRLYRQVIIRLIRINAILNANFKIMFVTHLRRITDTNTIHQSLSLGHLESNLF